MSYEESLLTMLGILGFALVFVLIALLLVYVISSIGYSKLYKCYGGWFSANAWMAWVPFLNLYIQAKFLQENNQEDEWVKWLLTFYWVLAFIPILGSIAVFVVAILCIVEWLKYFGRLNVGIGIYILYFVFPIVVPFMLVSHIKKNGFGNNTYTQNFYNYNQPNMQYDNNSNMSNYQSNYYEDNYSQNQ